MYDREYAACRLRRITPRCVGLAWMCVDHEARPHLYPSRGSARASCLVLGTALCYSICGHPPAGCCLLGVAMCIDISDTFKGTARATAQNSAGAQCTRTHRVDAGAVSNICAANEDIVLRQKLKGSCVRVLRAIQSDDLFDS